MDQTCELCRVSSEHHGHLFFQCRVVREAWDTIREWLSINRRITTVRSGLKWLHKYVKGTTWLSRARRIAFTSIIYFIWIARNRSLKDNAAITGAMLVTQVQIHVYPSLFVKFPEFERRFTRLVGSCYDGEFRPLVVRYGAKHVRNTHTQFLVERYNGPQRICGPNGGSDFCALLGNPSAAVGRLGSGD